MGQATVALTRSDDLFMAGSICFSKDEIVAVVDVKAFVTAKADKLRDDFIEKTLDEIAKREWA